MNTFAACGLVAMLIALWIGQDVDYPANGFAVGMFVAGAVILIMSGWFNEWYWTWRWRREEPRDEALAAQEDAEGEPFGGQWE